MNKWIKENWFKLFLGLMILIACVSSGYYFFTFLPQEKKLVEERKVLAYNQEQNQKCSTAGSVFFKNFKQESDKALTETVGVSPNSFENPIFHFNPKLKTCLVEISYTIYWMGKDAVFVSLVKDVYSNKLVITSTWSSDTSLNLNLPYEEYKKQADALMSE